MKAETIPTRVRAIARCLNKLPFLCLVLSLGVAHAATPRQPRQPATGPGGSNYPHANFRVSAGGSGADAWFVFEPTDPKPVSAPLAIMMHGWDEFAGYDQLRAMIEHTVRKGSVVIYPRWQTGIVTPCPGPYNIEPCLASALNGIRGGIEYLQSDGERVQPQLEATNYFAFSFGGIVLANMLNRWQSLDLPQPRTIFFDDPHDGGLTDTGEPSLDADLSGIPSTTLAVCHAGAKGVFDDFFTTLDGQIDASRPMSDSSCNALFPLLASIPIQNKSLVLTSDDDHGSPALSSSHHGICFGVAPDAYDWGVCWKIWDALRSCAATSTDCEFALGNTAEQRYIGTWSDGTPIIGLKVQTQAPIRAEPVPEREPTPANVAMNDTNHSGGGVLSWISLTALVALRKLRRR